MRAARLTLLGGFAASDSDEAIRIPSSSQRVLALTALHDGPLPRRLAARRLWPHLREPSALASLRTALSRLHAAHPALIVNDAESLCLAAPVAVDVSQHEELALRLIRGDADDLPADVPVSTLTTPLLPDWEDEWVTFERDRVHELFLHAIEAHAARLAERRQFALALTTIYAVLSTDSLRESAARTLIAIHLAEGNRAQAVRCYLDFRQRLLAGIGMEPSEELRELIAALLVRRGVARAD